MKDERKEAMTIWDESEEISVLAEDELVKAGILPQGVPFIDDVKKANLLVEEAEDGVVATFLSKSGEKTELKLTAKQMARTLDYYERASGLDGNIFKRCPLNVQNAYKEMQQEKATEQEMKKVAEMERD